MGSHFAMQTSCCKMTGELEYNASGSHFVIQLVVAN